jgi:hypothetical protein
MSYMPGVGAGDRVQINMHVPHDLNGKFGVVKFVSLGAERIAVKLDEDDSETYRYFSAEELLKYDDTPTKEKKMEEKYGFRVGDKVETRFNEVLKRGVITDLNPRDYREDQVAIRFEDYGAYGSDKDFHGWPVKELTKVETAPIFKKGDRVCVNCLDEHSDEGMRRLVGMWGEIQDPDYHPGSGKDKDCATVRFGTSTYYFCKTSLLHEGDAKPEPRAFKVGDMVRVKCLDAKSVSSMQDLVGATGRVNRIGPEGHVHIEITSPRGAQCFFLPASLELISEEVPSLSPKEKKAEFARAYGAAAALRTTVSATIILASGREVRMPDPPAEKWTQDRSGTYDFGHCVAVGTTLEEGTLAVEGTTLGKITHDEGLCWLRDMARIVNIREQKSPFEIRFSCIKEIRYFLEKPPKAEEKYTNADSVLATLW